MPIIEFSRPLRSLLAYHHQAAARDARSMRRALATGARAPAAAFDDDYRRCLSRFERCSFPGGASRLGRCWYCAAAAKHFKRRAEVFLGRAWLIAGSDEFSADA